MARGDLVERTVLLGRDLDDRLNALAKDPGVTKSAIVRQALAAWLDRKGEDESELRFAKRVDRLSAQLARIERDVHIVIESLALFVRYMLTVNPPISENDDAARALGRERFAVFVQRVSQQLASGRTTFVPNDDP